MTVTNIYVRIDKNYGRTAIYPACETAEKLADLLGTKTFTDSALRKLAALGYNVQVRQASAVFKVTYA